MSWTIKIFRVLDSGRVAMSSDVYETLLLVMLGALFSIWLIEQLLSATWNKMYFTTGLQIFVVQIPVELRYSNIPSSSQFETRFHSTWWSYSLVFKEIEVDTYGFREKFFDFRIFGLRYSPMMHGLLFFDRNNKQVVVKGFVNWTVLPFALIFLGSFLMSPFSDVMLVLIFLFLTLGLGYSIQYYQFYDVAKFAAEVWAKKHIKDNDFFGY